MSDRRGGITHEPGVPYLPDDSGEADSLVRDMLMMMQRMALDARSTLGTVMDVLDAVKGELIVHIDDEAIPRTVGFARTKGVTYQTGDRVKLSLLRNDEWVVDGLVDADPDDNSVTIDNLATDSVGWDELVFGSVSWEHLTVAMRNLLNSYATNTDLTEVKTTANSAWNKADSAQTSAKNADDHAQNVFNVLDPRITTLETKVRKLGG